MSKVYIFGAGGHAHVIASFLKAEPVFVVDEPADPSVLSISTYFAELPPGDAYIGIGSNPVRKRIAERLRASGVNMPPCVAPTAFVARDAELAGGAVVCAGAVIGSRCKIGRDTIVNTLSSVDHDCVLGDLSQVTAGVTFGGTVTVGSNCFFGIRSAIVPNRRIGSNAQIMAGSMVVSDIDDDVLVGGNPARLVRRLDAAA